MNSYQKVSPPKQNEVENQIFVNAKGSAAVVANRASGLFSEGKHKDVTLKATGSAISTAVTAAELVKHRVKGIHQITTIGTTNMSTTFQPTVEGLEVYQAPLSNEEFEAIQRVPRTSGLARGGPRRGRGGHRGGTRRSPAEGNHTSASTATPAAGDASSSNAIPGVGPRGRGRGRGRGRASRGRRSETSGDASASSNSAAADPSSNTSNHESNRAPYAHRRGGPRRGRGGPQQRTNRIQQPATSKQ